MIFVFAFLILPDFGANILSAFPAVAVLYDWLKGGVESSFGFNLKVFRPRRE